MDDFCTRVPFRDFLVSVVFLPSPVTRTLPNVQHSSSPLYSGNSFKRDFHCANPIIPRSSSLAEPFCRDSCASLEKYFFVSDLLYPRSLPAIVVYFFQAPPSFPTKETIFLRCGFDLAPLCIHSHFPFVKTGRTSALSFLEGWADRTAGDGVFQATKVAGSRNG